MSRTAKLFKAIRGALAFVSLLMLFAYLVGLVIFFTLNKEVLSDLKAAVSVVAGVVPVAIIIAKVNKRLGERLDRPDRTISAALRDFLVEEPLLLGMVWVFLGIGLVVGSYFWPYYRITATLEDGSGNGPFGEFVLVGQSDNVTFPFKKVGEQFLSSMRMGWGDSLVVYAEGDQGQLVGAAVKWTGIPLFHLLSSKNVPLSVKKQMAQVTIQGNPEETKINARSGGDFLGDHLSPCLLRLPINSHLELSLTAGDRYQQDDIHALILGDTTIQFDLAKTPGMLTLTASYAAGMELQGGDVYILRGNVWEPLPGFEFGTPTPMAAGTHQLRICDIRGDGTVISSDEETVVVLPAQSITHRFEVRRRPGTLCGF